LTVLEKRDKEFPSEEMGVGREGKEGGRHDESIAPVVSPGGSTYGCASKTLKRRRQGEPIIVKVLWKGGKWRGERKNLRLR